METLTLVSILLFGALVCGICWWGYRLYVRPVGIGDRLGARVAIAEPAPLEELRRPEKRLLVRMIQYIGEQVPVSPEDASLARRQLMAAGFRSDLAVQVYFGLKIVMCAGLLVAAFLLRNQLTSNAVLRIVLVAGGGALGFFGPNLVVDHLVTRRHEKLRFSLPDALDLMVVCMEAGLGLDQATVNVSRELQITHPEISEEFGLVSLEMRAGKRRSEALKDLASRTGEAELRKLVATLVQADRFGTSIADSLRTHADFMRVRRRQEAEERAAKVGVKLVFPIFFFIMPAMLVVAAGPGLLMLFKNLFPMMQGIGR
jgi:tight adherence protein C